MCEKSKRIEFVDCEQINFLTDKIIKRLELGIEKTGMIQELLFEGFYELRKKNQEQSTCKGDIENEYKNKSSRD